MIEISKDEYINSLLREIEKLQKRGVRALYRINDRVRNSVISQTVNYFKALPGYTITTKRCQGCKNNTWDIIITFKLKDDEIAKL